MAIERQTDPLPLGVYWVDVDADKLEGFRNWLAENKGRVRVRTQKETYVQGMFGDTDEVASMWVLFESIAPVRWKGPGYPTIAEQGKTTTKESTAQVPEVEGPSLFPDLGTTVKEKAKEQLLPGLPGAASGGTSWFPILLALGGGFFAYRFIRGKAEGFARTVARKARA